MYHLSVTTGTMLWLFCIIFAQFVRFSSAANINCAPVKTVINSSLIASSPIASQDLEICASQESCCTKQTETAFEQTVRLELSEELVNASSLLSSLFVNNLEALKDAFINTLLLEMNNTLVMFKDGDHEMINETRALFTAFVDFVNDKFFEHNLKPNIQRYFRKLFPRFYINYIIDSQTINTDKNQLQLCIQSNSVEMNPLIAAISDRLEETLAQTITDVKYVINSLSLSIEVVNAAITYTISEKCTREFTKLFYCKYCKGFINVKPCFGYCVNIARQCISPLSDLDLKWIQFISTLKRFIHNFVVKNNLELLNAVVYKWMFKIFDSINEVNAKVRSVCSAHLHRKISNKKLLTLTLTPTNRRINYQQILLKHLNDFAEKVMSTKDFFSQISDAWCKKSATEDLSSELFTSRCWNGSHIENYSSMTSFEIESHGIADIKLNIVKEEIAKIAELKLKLDKQIKMLLVVDERENLPWPIDDEDLNEDYSGGSGFIIDPYAEYYETDGSGVPFDEPSTTVSTTGSDDIVFTDIKENNGSDASLTERDLKVNAVGSHSSTNLIYIFLITTLVVLFV